MRPDLLRISSLLAIVITVLFLVISYSPLSSASETRAVDTDALPGAPRNLSLEIIREHVEILWNAPEGYLDQGIIFFNIYKNDDGSGWEKTFVYDVKSCEEDMFDNDYDGLVDEAGEGAYSNVYYDENIKEGRKYSYKICAENDNGEGPYSEIASIQYGEKKTIPGFDPLIMVLAGFILVLVLKQGANGVGRGPGG